jgi:hypothetical protein
MTSADVIDEVAQGGVVGVAADLAEVVPFVVELR